jgi:hypothetical protein
MCRGITRKLAREELNPSWCNRPRGFIGRKEVRSNEEDFVKETGQGSERRDILSLVKKMLSIRCLHSREDGSKKQSE